MSHQLELTHFSRLQCVYSSAVCTGGIGSGSSTGGYIIDTSAGRFRISHLTPRHSRTLPAYNRALHRQVRNTSQASYNRLQIESFTQSILSTTI